jgi:hypothetical protein
VKAIAHEAAVLGFVIGSGSVPAVKDGVAGLMALGSELIKGKDPTGGGVVREAKECRLKPTKKLCVNCLDNMVKMKHILAYDAPVLMTDIHIARRDVMFGMSTSLSYPTVAFQSHMRRAMSGPIELLRRRIRALPYKSCIATESAVEMRDLSLSPLDIEILKRIRYIEANRQIAVPVMINYLGLSDWHPMLVQRAATQLAAKGYLFLSEGRIQLTDEGKHEIKYHMYCHDFRERRVRSTPFMDDVAKRGLGAATVAIRQRERSYADSVRGHGHRPLDVLTYVADERGNARKIDALFIDSKE